MAGITRRNCEAQCDRIFHGRCRASSAWQLQSWYERWWQFVCAWGRVCVCVHLPGKKKKKRGKSSWKKNIPINKDSAQNNKVSPCSKALWLPLYLPLFPVSPPLPLPSPHLFFDHCPFFLQASLLLWLCTFCVCVCVWVLSPFFLSFPPLVSPRLWSASQTCTTLFPLSCSSFAVPLSSSPRHLLSLYLCSFGFVPLLTSLCFPIPTHRTPPLANLDHQLTSSPLNPTKQRPVTKAEFEMAFRMLTDARKSQPWINKTIKPQWLWSEVNN